MSDNNEIQNKKARKAAAWFVITVLVILGVALVATFISFVQAVMH